MLNIIKTAYPAILLILLLASCNSGPSSSGSSSSSSGGVNSSSSSSGSGIFIFANIFTVASGTAVNESVQVQDSGNNQISTATVILNGSPMTWNGGQSSYIGNVTIGAGASVTVTVTYNSITYTATGTQYTAPVITAPANVPDWNSSLPNTVTWSAGSPATGIEYFIGIFTNLSPSNSPYYSIIIPSGTLTTNLPPSIWASATGLSSGAPIDIFVGIVTTGFGNSGLSTGGISFSPSPLSGSGMWLGSFSLTNVTLN